MDRAQESGKKKIAKQHSETITCKMQATETTADRELCLKSEKRFSPRSSHSSKEKHQPGSGSERTAASFLPCPQCQLAACPPRSASKFLYMRV